MKRFAKIFNDFLLLITLTKCSTRLKSQTWIGSIYKNVSLFILVLRGRQVTEIPKGNRFSWPTCWFTFDLPDKLFVPGDFLKAELLLQSAKRRNYILATDVSAWLVSVSDVYFRLETVFLKFFENFHENYHYGEWFQ